MLALFDGERPVIGVLYQPYTDELFSGDNETAWFERGGQSQSLSTSVCELVEDACLSTTGIDWLASSEQRRFKQLSDATKLTKLGGDCYLFGMLAMGSLDLGVEAGLKAYDIQALMPIVRGAGGVVTDWEEVIPVWAVRCWLQLTRLCMPGHWLCWQGLSARVFSATHISERIE